MARPARLELATSWFVAVNAFVDPAQLTGPSELKRPATWTQSWTPIVAIRARPRATLKRALRHTRSASYPSKSSNLVCVGKPRCSSRF